VRNIIKFSAARFQFRSADGWLVFFLPAARLQIHHAPMSIQPFAEMISCTHRSLLVNTKHTMMLRVKLLAAAEIVSVIRSAQEAIGVLPFLRTLALLALA
jgi:hypothetical protein